MKTFTGTDRIAYVGERYTYKFARSNPQGFLECAEYTYGLRGIDEVIENWDEYTPVVRHSLQYFLLHGVNANQREHRLAQMYPDVVIPTGTISNGAINIQPTVPTAPVPFKAVHMAFLDQMDHRIVHLSHMFETMNNFGVHDGQVKFVDGASPHLEDLMESEPDSIRAALGTLTLQLDP